jgi:mono/diheme cytochrome c family protein
MLARAMAVATVGMLTAFAAEAAELAVTLGDRTVRIESAAMLARADIATVSVAADPVYRRAMSYRAVPLADLLGELGGIEHLEVRAADSYAGQIPVELVVAAAKGGSRPWLAVEDPAQPWPVVPGRAASAGPFYLIWENPERSGVKNEQWPYQVATIVATLAPERRWPQLGVGADLAADHPVRLGQAVFISMCLVCHTLNGAGAPTLGPDLNSPMSPTQYLTPEGLRKIIRDPQSVRAWPQQQMAGFDSGSLSEAELDGLIAFLAYKAGARH